MTLFNSDLYRNFGIGFGAGVVAIVIASGGEILAAIPQMVASIF